MSHLPCDRLVSPSWTKPKKSKKKQSVTTQYSVLRQDEDFPGIIRIRPIGIPKANKWGFKPGDRVKVTIKRMKA